MPKKFYPYVITAYNLNEYGKIEISEIKVYDDEGKYLKTLKPPQLEAFVPFLAKNTCVWKPVDMEDEYDI